MRPFLARTDLAPLLGDDAELYARLGPTLHLAPHEAPTIVLLRLAVRAPWLANLVIGRLHKETAIPAEQRALLIELAAACEARQAADDDGSLSTMNDDDDAADARWWQSLCAELRALVARFG